MIFKVPITSIKIDVVGSEGQRFDKNIVITENKVLKLECSSTNSRPLPDITLRVGDKTLVSKNFSESNGLRVNAYELNVTRELQSSKVVCESRMRGVTHAVAEKLGIVNTYLRTIEYTLVVQCKFFCIFF